MNDEIERIRQRRIEVASVSLGGISFLVKRPTGDQWVLCAKEGQEAATRLGEAQDVKERMAAEDIMWRRLVVDHVPGLTAAWPTIQAVVTLEEMAAAASICMGIPFDLRAQA